MSHDSPPPSWYEPDDDGEDTHKCKGVWCLHESHQDDN